MKNYLKIENLFFSVILLSLFSCNKDDADSNSNNGEVRYLSTLTASYGDPTYPKYSSKDTLVYENGRIIKSFLRAGCDPSVQQYEYGNNGKISKIYRAGFSRNEPPYDYPQVGDLIEMFENATIREYDEYPVTLEYDSENRLIGTDYGSRWEYDDQGRLFKKMGSGISYTVKEFDDKGNPLLITRNYGGSLSERSYTYGTLKNPYYVLFNKYGLIQVDCVLEQTFLTPNVVSSTTNRDYLYYSDGEYPSSVQFYGSAGLSIFDFTYR